MKTDKLIIAISGSKSAGKDTIATMLEYIISVGITKAKYNEWYTKYVANEDNPTNVIHFADKLKTLCAEITNLPKHLFDKHEYKDVYWWIYGTPDFATSECFEEETIQRTGKKYYQIASCNVLTFEEQLERARHRNEIPVVRLRTILQFVGTEMFKTMFDRNYWISDTIRRARMLCNDSRFCIIADLRFPDEAIQTRYACNASGINFIILNIGTEETFQKPINERGLHESDKVLKDFDYYFQNKKDSLFVLFNKVLEFYQKQILK